jgi:hypothetical protein
VQGTDNSTEIIGYKSNLSYYTRCVPPQAILDTLDMDTINPVVIESTPFNGPHIISASGENIVPARDFDFVGEGLAFHDDGNNDTGHNYRSTNGDPEGDKADVQSDGNIGYSNPGEWFVYTIEVQDAGVYAVDIYESGEGNGKFSVSIDGNKSETIDVPSNGNWSNWRWLLETNPNAQPKFRLSAGKHKFRFTYEASGFNYMAFRLNYVGE